MRFDTPIFVSGLGSYLPQRRIDPAEALAQGVITPRDIADTDYESIAIEDDLFPPAMASRAAREAMAASGLRGDDLEMVVFVANHRHGHRLFWSPASFLQREVGASRAFGINVYAGCTAQVAMSDVAVSYLLADPARRAALVVGADNYGTSPGSRWTSDYGIFMGDGAAAVVYAKTGGVARVLSANSRTVGELEEVHRMDHPAVQSDATWKSEYEVRETKKRFLMAKGPESLARTTREITVELYRKSLDEAGIKAGDVKKLLLPNLGKKLMESTYFPLCEGDVERCLWFSHGRAIGHIGPPDQVIALQHLLRTGGVRSGDHVALMGAGAGFSWSCMIVQIA